MSFQINTKAQDKHIKAALDALQIKFAQVAFSYGVMILEARGSELTGAALVSLQCDSEELAVLANQLRGQLRGEQS